jgi:hypothetical protein
MSYPGREVNLRPFPSFPRKLDSRPKLDRISGFRRNDEAPMPIPFPGGPLQRLRVGQEAETRRT